MNRDQRAHIAHETLHILEHGTYQTGSGQAISIAEALAIASATNSALLPHDYDYLLAQIEQQAPRQPRTLAVSNQTTLAAAQALISDYPKLACLNFASAMNSGGGFLSGSQAQEESLARASGLYATLQTKPAFYTYHRRRDTCLYSDHVIFSPNVPVFRDDAGELLDQPWQAAFITAAAVNAGAVRKHEPQNIHRIPSTLEHRARMVLAIAVLHQCDAIVLGAWGCGVFQNDPVEVAEIFARLLDEPLFRDRFQHIEFAVLDTSINQTVVRAFQKML